MRPRSLIPLVIGLAVGFFAIKLGLDVVKKARAGEGDESRVVVSARRINAAAAITPSMLTFKTVPASLAPPDTFKDAKDLTTRVTTMAIPAGVPVTESMLAPPGAEPGLRATIPPGLRAVSVKVNEESAVAGFVTPGSRVDVSAVAKRGGASKLILSNVQVGAVGQSLSEVGPDGKTARVTKSVTLFVRPDEVEVLNAHAAAGRIRLALRSYDEHQDAAPEQDAGGFWGALFQQALSGAGTSYAASDVVPVKTHVVDVVRGAKTQRLVFTKAGRDSDYKLVQVLDPGAAHRNEARE